VRLESLHPQFDFDHWSRLPGWLQQSVDPRTKIASAFVLLLGVALARPSSFTASLRFGAAAVALLAFLALSSRLPFLGLLRRALLVLPFALVFAAVTAWSGDPQRAVLLLVKTLISASTAILLAASTPLEDLLAALARLGAPPFFLNVVLLLYRYLFVFAEQAQRMRFAAAARGATRSLPAVAGNAAVLFARAQERAARIHQSMLARGFRGEFLPLRPLAFRLSDFAVLCSACLLAATARAWSGA
jgi:cobalt/nickel transport system permease protein